MKTPSLICGIQGRRIAIAVAEIEQIVDFERVPLPLAQPWIGGLGLQAQLVFLLVTLNAQAAPVPGTVSKGLLMRGGAGSMRWGLEVEAVHHVQETSAVGGEGPAWPGCTAPKGWLLNTKGDSELAAWLDTQAVMQTLKAHV